MNKIEKILDNISKAKYGVDFTKEHGRIYYRTDIIKAMKEFGKLCFEAGGEGMIYSPEETGEYCWIYEDFLKSIEDVV